MLYPFVTPMAPPTIEGGFATGQCSAAPRLFLNRTRSGRVGPKRCTVCQTQSTLTLRPALRGPDCWSLWTLKSPKNESCASPLCAGRALKHCHDVWPTSSMVKNPTGLPQWIIMIVIYHPQYIRYSLNTYHASSHHLQLRQHSNTVPPSGWSPRWQVSALGPLGATRWYLVTSWWFVPPPVQSFTFRGIHSTSTLTDQEQNPTVWLYPNVGKQ